MFAVLKTGGKQYKVQSGDVLRVELVAAEALVAGAAVQAEVIDNIKADKVIHYVKRRRKHSSQRTKGHRQKLTLVRVTDILASGAETSGVKVAIGTASARRAAHDAAPVAEAAAAPAKPKRAAKAAAAPAQE
jgi:large subunit ribosomal protein L21